MAIAPMSADQSAAAWAGDAAGAAEAYVDAQADAAAALRDAEEKLQAQLAALAASQNDGVDPPPPPPPAGLSSVGGTGSSGVGSSPVVGTSSGGGGGVPLVPDGNGNFTLEVVVVNQQAPPPWSLNLPIANAGSGTSSVQTPSNTPPPPDPQAAPNGTNQVNEPDQPEKPKVAPPVVTGLGEDVDRILNVSPLLREQWAKLFAAGWRIEFTDKKSHTDYEAMRIRLNPAEANTLARGVVLFSHELGHAVSGGPKQVTAQEVPDKGEYVRRNVEERLAAEGAAAFENCRHREEIQEWSDIDITIAGKGADGPYLQVYEDFKSGKISEQTAKSRMSQLAGAEPEYRDGTTKRQAYTAEEARDYETERKNAR
jgi:hypothetical protein